MGQKKAKQRNSSKPKSGLGPPVVDRRAMEKSLRDLGKLLSEREFGSLEAANAFLQEIVAAGGPPPAASETPLEQAQALMYEAWDASGRQRVQLARQALEISQDCADAYVLLAEDAAANLEEAKRFYAEGIQAGERALGARAFQEDVGHFWGILETRPYMRARLGLAQCLWVGERQQAIEHFTEMLRLNPGDNQGIRDLLVNCLLAERADEAVAKLLDQYEEDASATWLYSRALWMFRKAGARGAEGQLRDALDGNRYVPAYLLGMKRLPKTLPEYIGFGDESEAIAYASEALEVWHKTPGALPWLASHLPH
ncbi:hypothetical protein HYR54_02315 [Candidatus Acetothermia bacterium]|nr:hypothetical protein [Candidatus Acetothermia bacterium]